MKRAARAIEFAAWTLFFLFAAAALALRFWLLPNIEHYREEIVAALSHAIGLPVRVGAIEAGWLGLRPQVTLSDVRISDAQGREALVLPAVENVLAWRSLLRGELRLNRIVIDRPRLAITRDGAGDVYVAGLKLGKGGSGGAFLGSGEFVVRNAEVEWRDERRRAPALKLTGVELRLVNSGAAQSIGVTAQPPPELGSSVELRAVLEPHELTGRVFLQLGYTDLAAWRAWVDYPVDVRHGQGALRVWARLDKGELREGTADVALADVWASLGDHLTPLELVSLRGRLHGRALPDGVELSGRGVRRCSTAARSSRPPTSRSSGGRRPAERSPRAASTCRRSRTWWSRCPCRRRSVTRWRSSIRAGGSTTRAWSGRAPSTRRRSLSRAPASAISRCAPATACRASGVCRAAWRERGRTGG